MKQLTALDNMFLTLEKGNQTMHVASLGIYDPSSAPGGKVRFKQILAHYVSRLELSKIFQRRLASVPLGIDLPFWVDEGDIDLEYHVRHMALPHPGDWRQLMIQIARIHSRPLDLKRPLWETYVIEGLDNIEGLPKGCFAIYCKLHHSLIDGETGAELVRLQHDLSPVGRPVENLRTHIADAPPTKLELVSRGISNRAKRIADGGRALLKLGSVGARLGAEMVGKVAADTSRLTDAVAGLFTASNPHNRFNRCVSPHRVVDGVGLPLEGFQTIRARLPGVTINDIFLSIAGGAVRLYLAAKHELPARTLHAAVPVSTHSGATNSDSGNSVSGTFTSLHTDVADPLERIRAVHQSMDASKSALNALGQDTLRQLSYLIPAAPVRLLQKYVVSPRASIIVSNVRGPDRPIYFAGARLVRFMPVSIASDGVGLNITGFSYDNQLWVCSVACRQVMPDPAFFSQCVRASYEQTVAAAANAEVPKSVRAAPKKPRPAARA
jgi:diacylglycerol O-acyltransferase